jgi:ubiquinone/menaquinone biosynthesis C-methylase UbiE
MADVYAAITAADPEMQARIADVLELRAADPQQRAMLETYTADLDLPRDARILEIGCGTGAVSRFLARLPGVAAVVGVDPCELFIERAHELAREENLTFVLGDGRELELEDESFDAVVFHTTLCHVPDCEQAIAQAHRLLARGGQVAVFDGDYIEKPHIRTNVVDDEDPRAHGSPAQCCRTIASSSPTSTGFAR